MSTFTRIKQRLVGPGDKLVGESKSSGAPLGNWGRFYLARNDGNIIYQLVFGDKTYQCPNKWFKAGYS